MVATMVAKKWPIVLLSLGLLALAMAIVLPMTVSAKFSGTVVKIDGTESGGDTLKVRVLGSGNSGFNGCVAVTGTAKEIKAGVTKEVTLDFSNVFGASTIQLFDGADCTGVPDVIIDLDPPNAGLDIFTLGNLFGNGYSGDEIDSLKFEIK